MKDDVVIAFVRLASKPANNREDRIVISSVIARLSPQCDFEALKNQLRLQARIEIGDLVPPHSLPLTIEACDQRQLKETHEWIRDLKDIDFVDVVSVFFLEPPGNETETATAPEGNQA